MGYYRNHGIIVSGLSADDAELNSARNMALSLGMTVTETVESPVNFTATFLVAPDGSKEGWDASNKGDAARKALIAHIRDKNLMLDWVEVQYGDDNGHTEVVDDSDSSYRAAR